MGINQSRRHSEIEDILLTETEAAQFLNIQPSTLATWRVRGIPHLPFVRVGRCIRYRRQDISLFINAHIAAHTGKGRA